jgi:hypothetical protein
MVADLGQYFRQNRANEPVSVGATLGGGTGGIGWKMPTAEQTINAAARSQPAPVQWNPMALVYNIQNHQPVTNYSPYQSIRYGLDGIPIIEPVPAWSANSVNTRPSSATLHNYNGTPSVTAPSPVLDLNDLDPNKLIERVRQIVDFANPDQCRSALRRYDFDVDRTARELKIERLIEMGLATDRDLATSALDSCQWNVNEAANRLIS